MQRKRKFKKETLELLDTLSRNKIPQKWKTICRERGIPDKSIVIKSNQKRNKIFEEANLNRSKKNVGNIRVTRQRRKLSSTKAGRNEYYPEAASLVFAEFKLRRGKGAKV